MSGQILWEELTEDNMAVGFLRKAVSKMLKGWDRDRALTNSLAKFCHPIEYILRRRFRSSLRHMTLTGLEAEKKGSLLDSINTPLQYVSTYALVSEIVAPL